MSSASPWNEGDRVMVSFVVTDEVPRPGMRVVTISGDGRKYTLPEECFVDHAAYEFVEHPSVGHDDWGG